MWNDIVRKDDPKGNVAKFIYYKDNAVAESVLYKYPEYNERTVICCSTQSGCPVGCRFCGAGDYFVRSFSAEEIVSQVDYSLDQTKIDPLTINRLQVMFMSMGEPMLNSKHLCSAIRTLHEKYPNAALLVSTIGPKVQWEEFFQVSKDVPKVGLQFSVHKSTDDERNKLIPFKHKLSLSEIAKLGTEWYNHVGRKPFFNYCAGEDNTSDSDVDNLRNLLDPTIWEATISVICERNDGMSQTNDTQRQLATDFANKILAKGYNVRVFDPAGQDTIGGGCGQLHFVQKWFQDHPDKARPSVGFSLPVVHAPKESCCGN